MSLLQQPYCPIGFLTFSSSKPLMHLTFRFFAGIIIRGSTLGYPTLGNPRIFGNFEIPNPRIFFEKSWDFLGFFHCSLHLHFGSKSKLYKVNCDFKLTTMNVKTVNYIMIRISQYSRMPIQRLNTYAKSSITCYFISTIDFCKRKISQSLPLKLF